MASNDDDSALERGHESSESNQSMGWGNPRRGMTSRQSNRSLAEFKTMVDGCRQDVGNFLLEKIRDIAQEATFDEAAYLSAATDNLAGRSLPKTTIAIFYPAEKASQTLLSSAKKLIEEYENFCEETALITGSKEPSSDWDVEYFQFASMFSRQGKVMRHWIRAYVNNKKFASSRRSASTGGNSVPEELVWGNLLASMGSNDKDSIRDNWAVAVTRAERGIHNLVKILSGSI